MKTLVLAALTEATGNCVTARRIAQHLAGEHDVLLVDASSASRGSLEALVQEKGIELAVGVHALLAGPFLARLRIPYALIFGGTDRCETTDELHRTQMAQAVAGATRLVAFSPENRARAEWMWPSCANRVTQLPQAVDVTGADPQFSLR